MGKAEYDIALELQELVAADREVETPATDLPRSAPASNRS
jgi:hypothetical protein